MRTLLLTLGAGLLPLMAVLSACSGDESAAQPQQEVAPAEAARAAFDAWLADLVSFEANATGLLDASPDATGRFLVEIAAQLEPFTAVVVIDSTELFDAYADEIDVDDEEDIESLLQTRYLLIGDKGYIQVPDGQGWYDAGTRDAEGIGDTDFLGSSPFALAEFETLDLVFDCVEAGSGEVILGEHEDRPVWWVQCTVDNDSRAAIGSNARQGLASSGLFQFPFFDSLNMRLAVSRDSGAPLLSEIEVRLPSSSLFNPEGDDEYNVVLASSLALLSWNDPLDFPTPEPLVDPEDSDWFSFPALSSDEQASSTAP